MRFGHTWGLGDEVGEWAHGGGVVDERQVVCSIAMFTTGD